MDIKHEAAQKLLELIKRNHAISVIAAVVKSTNATTMLCDVETMDDLEVFDVRLSAIEDNDKGLRIVPKVGSTILIGNIGASKTEYFMVAHEEIESLSVTIGQTKFELASNKLKLEKGGQNLGAVLKELIDAIRAITVTTPSGPSVIPLLNDAQFVALKTKLNQLF